MKLMPEGLRKLRDKIPLPSDEELRAMRSSLEATLGDRVAKVWACLIRRENGDTDTLHLCRPCQETTRDFATILKRTPIQGRCDRCESESC